MKKFVLLTIVGLWLTTTIRAEWQWSVEIPEIVSSETGTHPDAFLWIPPTCKHLNAVLIGTHNMDEQPLFERKVFRQRMEKLGIGIIWIVPGWDQEWKADSESPAAYDHMLRNLAEKSGYSELATVPIVPVGHSAMATYPWNFAAWNSGRTLAVISYHGDAPRTNLTGYGRSNLEWGRTRNINGIPGLMIVGEYEWWEDRVTPALAFSMMYPESCISFLCDTGRGHFDVSDRTAEYIATFLEKAIEQRLSETTVDGQIKLSPVKRSEGWLAERWRPYPQKRAKAAPYGKYKGDIHDAFWYFDEEMAQLTEKRYADERGKKMQYLGIGQDGRLMPYDAKNRVNANPVFRPEVDGVTLHVAARFTDSLRTTPVTVHAAGAPQISIICGPVEKENDSTFVVRFNRVGMYNPKRSFDIWLVAEHPGDKNYKSTVQPFNIRLPYRLTEGRRQCLMFPGIDDVHVGTTSVTPMAQSDCGLPVYYYIKEGPAEVKDGQIVLTQIPPRTKFPVKVTVVAWQYGIRGKIQTAEPVERSFYIVK